MKHLKKLSAILVISLSPLILFAAESPQLPKALLYQDKPINPSCIARLLNEDIKSVHLTSCDTDKKIKIENINKDLISKGYIGFDYTSKEKESGFVIHGIIYYRYLGQHKDTYLIETMESQGGSGFFTAIIQLKRQDNEIQKVATIVSGDRCNGGLDKVDWKDGKLYYSQNITPFDYITLANENSAKIKAYDNLAACAACCSGKAYYEYDLKAQLLKIELDPELEKSTASGQGDLQSCFNKILVKNYINQGKKVLTPLELRDFVKTFNQECMSS